MHKLTILVTIPLFSCNWGGVLLGLQAKVLRKNMPLVFIPLLPPWPRRRLPGLP